MNKKTWLLVVMLMVSIATFAQKKDNIKTVIFTTTPQMHCESCEKKIKGNLRFEKGVKKIETDIPSQKVTVTFDSRKTNPEKLKKGFTKFGYEAREVKKDENVKINADESCPNM